MRPLRVEAPQLRRLGPPLTVRVGLSEVERSTLLARGVRPPEPVAVTALIDTGSGRSILQQDLARELGLTPVGRVEIDTPSSTDLSVLEYYARIWFDGTASVECKVLEAPLHVPQVRALLGRDVLASTRFVYDGRASSFELAL